MSTYTPKTRYSKFIANLDIVKSLGVIRAWPKEPESKEPGQRSLSKRIFQNGQRNLSQKSLGQRSLGKNLNKTLFNLTT